ncbi:MAG: recombinase family protein [Bacteriovoracaceae bacterium]
MKHEKLSLSAIARCLKEMKIPTKKRGKSWHPQMIKRILG